MGRARMADYLLGIEGIALIRRWLERDAVRAEARVEEIRKILAELGSGFPSIEIDVPERDVEAGYGEWSSTYDEMPNPLIQIEEPILRAWLEPIPPGDALDAACGTGRHTKWLHDRGHRVVGVDASEGMLVKAREKLPEVPLHAGPLTAIPADDASFDVVVCALAMAHLDDMRPAFAELARVTRPQGRLFVTDFHPLMVALGGQGLFQKPDGTYAFVRSHPHGVGDYVNAATDAGWTVRRCAEPRWDEESARILAGPLADYSPDAFEEAMVGLPGAVVLELAV